MGGLALVAALLAFVGALASPAPIPTRLDPDVLTGPSPRAIVRFTHDVDDATVVRLANIGITKAARFDSIDAVGVLGPRAVYEKIARWADVAYVDDDSQIHFDNAVSKKDTRVTAVRSGNAPLHKKYTGGGVTVAVMDTGIADVHPDLSGQVIDHVNFEPAWVFDQIDDGSISDPVAELTGTGIDTMGHGTHVAGTVAGTGASSVTANYSGVAPGAKLVNLKIADAWQTAGDIGWEFNALAAYEYAIEHRNDERYPGGIRIISNSWSTYEVDSNAEPIVLIVKEAAKAGIISVFAAGNAGPKDNTVAVGPNRLPEVITVAAACKSDDSSCGKGKIASFSSRGPQVDIAAPGDTVYSTVSFTSPDGHLGAIPADDPREALFYVGYSGTSMATPHVSGIVALMLEANPKLSRYRVQQILNATAQDRGKRGFDHTWGHGFVDALAAVKAAEALKR
jgi:serine protease AprX